MSPIRVSKQRRWLAVAAGVLVVVVGLGIAAARATRSTMAAMSDAGPVVPTTRVQQGAMDLTIYMTGELRASRQQSILAPPVGGSLRVLTAVDTGDQVKAGDLILSFDPADQRYALEQAQSELLEAEQNILKRQADIGAQEASDEVALLTARFNVRRAELDAAVDRDLIPANEHQIRQVSLEEARRNLEQTEQDVKARASASTAGLSVLQESRMKAQMAADRARQNMEMLELRAPIDGVVSVRENLDATGGYYFSGMTLPPYRVGDVANPGRPMIDIFDTSGMEIRAIVNEQDRVNLAVGQAVSVTSNSVPGLNLSAKVTTISGQGRAMIQKGPLRLFDVTLALDSTDPRLLPGTSVDLTAAGPAISDALVVPRQAVFEEDGKTVVYVKTGAGFEMQPVKVLHRGESRASLEGIEPGTEVALVKPGSLPSTAAGSSTAAPATGGPAVAR